MPPPPISPPLLAWYNQNRRSLPWRDAPSPYGVWVSEIMLQQTRVAAVLPYYLRWMEALPTVEALADADGETLMKLWQGLLQPRQKPAEGRAGDRGGAGRALSGHL